MKTVMKKLLSIALVAVLLISAVPFQADAATTKVGVAIKLTDAITHEDKAGIDCGTVISTILPTGATMLAEYKSRFALGNDEDLQFQGWVYTTGVNAGQAVNTSHVLSADMANEGGWIGIKAVFGYPVKNITLDAKGGTVTPAAVAVTKGGVYPSLPNPTRAGYLFNGWYLDGTDTRVDSGDAVASYTGLYAKWVDGTFKVSFEKWDGTKFVEYTSYEVAPGKTMKEMLFNMPTYSAEFGEKVGYTVDGWVDVNGNAFTADTKVNSELKIRPNFEANTYTITYDFECDEMEDEKVQVKYDSVVTLKQPQRANYVFLKWLAVEDNYAEFKTGDTYKYGNITLKAQWAPKGTVTLRIYNKDCSKYQQFTYNGAIMGQNLNLNDCDARDFITDGTFDFDGWFDYNGWVSYRGTDYADKSGKITSIHVPTSNTVNSTETVIYGRIYNFQENSSTGSGNTGNTGNTGNNNNNTNKEPVDPSNPQTGDMIGVSLALMMSTAGAAVVLSKKRK